MIIVKIGVVIHGFQQKEFIQLVASSIIGTRRKAGCLSCDCCQDIETPNAFWYIEEWLSLQQAEEHFRSERFQALLAGMKVLGDIEDFKVITSAKVSGIESL